jgi:hypothetical protein
MAPGSLKSSFSPAHPPRKKRRGEDYLPFR